MNYKNIKKEQKNDNDQGKSGLTWLLPGLMEDGGRAGRPRSSCPADGGRKDFISTIGRVWEKNFIESLTSALSLM